MAVYSRNFEEVAETVSFIRGRVLWACAAALLIALIGGWVVARRLARRVRRVERAANDVARGHIDREPLPVDSEDELGQLTRTFNAMQQQLREVDIARKEFIATASHELRTPIFSLAGFVELLQDEDLDDETRREFVDTMREQVERLQKLSVDLLDLSRLDSGSVELHTEPVDLAELTRSVVGEFRPALQTTDTELHMEVPEEGPLAECDRERVAQIMRILLDNALRHTPAGTDVTVSAQRENGSAEFTVADDGPGLPPGSRDKAFERFYTGDAARGAGLGLAIARELAERMDGRLVLDDRPGQHRVRPRACPRTDPNREERPWRSWARRSRSSRQAAMPPATTTGLGRCKPRRARSRRRASRWSRGSAARVASTRRRSTRSSRRASSR